VPPTQEERPMFAQQVPVAAAWGEKPPFPGILLHVAAAPAQQPSAEGERHTDVERQTDCRAGGCARRLPSPRDWFDLPPATPIHMPPAADLMRSRADLPFGQWSKAEVLTELLDRSSRVRLLIPGHGPATRLPLPERLLHRGENLAFARPAGGREHHLPAG